uniref:NAD-dependent epimerase/dehydratase domain-containing protein n=1 Tax=Ditylum brightwellii TaxID=49249 RepID=A0A7S4V088_9STRA
MVDEEEARNININQHSDGLHRRHFQQHPHSNIQPNRESREALQQQQQQTKARGKSKQQERSSAMKSLLRMSVAISVGLYLFLVARGFYVLERSDRKDVLLVSSQRPIHGMPVEDSMAGLERDDRWKAQDVGRRLAEERSRQRRARLNTVMQSSGTNGKHTQRYAFAHTSTEDAPHTSDSSNDVHENSPEISTLCGVHAQTAARTHTSAYQPRDALTPNSRVLITGILSPLGFHLALHLRHHCGVTQIYGIDHMYPNSALHRLHLMRRVALLTKHIPSLLKQPLLLPFVGLDPRADKRKTPASISPTQEIHLIKEYNPTHIVHLSSAAPHAYAAPHTHYDNTDSPYSHAPLFQIRQPSASMEHLLASIHANHTTPRPHFLYASSHRITMDNLHNSHSQSHSQHGQNHEWGASPKSSTQPQPKDTQYHLHSASGLVDETLARSYHALHNIYSVGLRLSTIYGPWGDPRDDIYSLAEHAVSTWHNTTDPQLLFDSPDNYLYVQDAVDSIIAAMQYRQEHDIPALFDIVSPQTFSLSTASNIMNQYKLTNTANDATTIDRKLKRSKYIQNENVNHNNNPNNEPLLLANTQNTQQYLNWTSQTSFHEGIMKLLAWHLDKAHPYGPPLQSHQTDDDASSFSETGNDFLSRHNAPLCAPDDKLCLQTTHVFPCASECAPASSSVCNPSAFDTVRDIVVDVTDGCDIAVLSQSLGQDVTDIARPMEFIEETTTAGLLPCNVFFVPKESQIVKTVISMVPPAAFQKIGIEGELLDITAPTEEQMDQLNGRLVHKGWILVWMDNAMTPLSHADSNLLKLSPGRFLHPNVKYAMYLEPYFASSPNIEDITFLVSEMSRKKSSNSHNKKLTWRDDTKSRRATLLTAQLETSTDPSHHTSLYDATKLMTKDMGGDPNKKEKGPSPTRQQRMFYERIISVVNKADLRSTFEPVRRYEIKNYNYIKSGWLLHDMTLNKARHLRCEWYEEHSRWESNLDQLTFAHIMASGELERKFVLDEPDDNVLAAMPKETDAHEWHELLYEGEAAEYEREHYKRKSLEEDVENHEELEDTLEDGEKDSTVRFCARVMSGDVIREERKLWTHIQNSRNKQKKAKK